MIHLKFLSLCINSLAKSNLTFDRPLYIENNPNFQSQFLFKKIRKLPTLLSFLYTFIHDHPHLKSTFESSAWLLTFQSSHISPLLEKKRKRIKFILWWSNRSDPTGKISNYTRFLANRRIVIQRIGAGRLVQLQPTRDSTVLRAWLRKLSTWLNVLLRQKLPQRGNRARCPPRGMAETFLNCHAARLEESFITKEEKIKKKKKEEIRLFLFFVAILWNKRTTIILFLQIIKSREKFLK